MSCPPFDAHFQSQRRSYHDLHIPPSSVEITPLLDSVVVIADGAVFADVVLIVAELVVADSDGGSPPSNSSKTIRNSKNTGFKIEPRHPKYLIISEVSIIGIYMYDYKTC